ncbi:MAG: ATP-binding protein [Clostridiales bacterium]|nr:ATP-binding protein [Clostridiales bacterium]
MFVGRKEEMSYLEKLYKSNKAEFVTIYGRRRIGKTELLNEFCKNKKSVFYSAKECTGVEQLRTFSAKMLGTDATFKNWEDAFLYLSKLETAEKTILVMDEFPYMVNSEKSIPSILQNLWDHKLKKLNIMIIICGSSMSFMEKKILSEKNPLYGRMTGIYKIEELGIEEISKFFPNYNEEKIFEVYSILGGVPYYLMQFSDTISVEANIKEAILDKGKILYSEVNFLMKQELRETQTYYTIIEKIALGNTKLNQIHTKTLIDKNKLTVYTKNLIELGILQKEYPVTEKLKARANVHTGLYKLSNNFFKFYFAYVFPNISELEQREIEWVYENEIEGSLNEYLSVEFEKLSIQYIKKLKIKNALNIKIKNIGRWWSKGTEIDIVAFSKQNEYIFGECKWTNKKVGTPVLDKLEEKVEQNFNPMVKEYYLFSKTGFTQEIQQLASENKKLHLITFEETMKM